VTLTTARSTTRIGLLWTSELSELLRTVHGPYRELFALMFAGHPVEFVDIALHRGDTPHSLADADVWIVPGAPEAVYDDLPWIASAEEVIRDAASSETAMFGICFGHQLIAQALGGRVEAATNGWGVGAVEYHTITAPPAWPDAPPAFAVLASHQDQVVAVPDDARVWCRSDHCPNAGLIVGERMWTMQPHPEFTVPLVSVLYPSRRDRIGDATTDAAMASLSRPLANREIADAVLAGVSAAGRRA